MAVGVHYPFDILVGAAVAIIFAYVMYKWVPRSKLVKYGFEDVQVVGYEHALTEAVAIGYLLGQGYSFQQAIEIVQSWWRP